MTSPEADSPASPVAPEAPRRAPFSLHLPGGGLTGALYQVGALAALEDGIPGLRDRDFDLFVGAGSGATVAAVLAAGVPVDRIYRALLDPADDFFPLTRDHVAHLDFDEWRRTLETGWVALRHALARLRPRRERVHTPAHVQLLDTPCGTDSG
jgi:predicted acylesterase/phospholipase RssA